MKPKKITTSSVPQNPIKTKKLVIDKEKIIFNFTLFNGNSINLDYFNNYYLDLHHAINAVGIFIEKIKAIENKTLKEVFDSRNKRQAHCHIIETKEEIDLIEKILLEGYKFPENRIKEFEKTYYQFSLDNGSRIIFHKIDNIFILLFIDNNHMIYKNKSRNIKIKEAHKFPSLLAPNKIPYTEEENKIRTEIITLISMCDTKNKEVKEIVDILKEIIDYQDIYV